MYHSTAQNLSLLGSILYATNDQVASLDAQKAGQGFGPIEFSGCRILPALHGRLGGRDVASVAHQVAHRALLVAGRCAFELTVRWIDWSEAVLRTKMIIFRVGGETKRAHSNYTTGPGKALAHWVCTYSWFGRSWIRVSALARFFTREIPLNLSSVAFSKYLARVRDEQM